VIKIEHTVFSFGECFNLYSSLGAVSISALDWYLSESKILSNFRKQILLFLKKKSIPITGYELEVHLVASLLGRCDQSILIVTTVCKLKESIEVFLILRMLLEVQRYKALCWEMTVLSLYMLSWKKRLYAFQHQKGVARSREVPFASKQ